MSAASAASSTAKATWRSGKAARSSDPAPRATKRSSRPPLSTSSRAKVFAAGIGGSFEAGSGFTVAGAESASTPSWRVLRQTCSSVETFSSKVRRTRS